MSKSRKKPAQKKTTTRAASANVDTRVAKVAASADADYQRGEDFYLGRGVRQDYVKARKYFEKAAKHGHAGAQHGLGFDLPARVRRSAGFREGTEVAREIRRAGICESSVQPGSTSRTRVRRPE